MEIIIRDVISIFHLNLSVNDVVIKFRRKFDAICDYFIIQRNEFLNDIFIMF